MNNEIISIITILVPSLLSVVSIIISLNALKKIKSLTQGVNDTNLENIIKKHIEVVNKCESNIKQANREFELIREETKKAIQKVGLVRYQAFRDTGGDQSFSLTLLDNNNDGVIVTGLYGRDLSKVFTKSVRNGETEKHKLTTEEEKSLQIALES